jgi:TPR repeat protein
VASQVDDVSCTPLSRSRAQAYALTQENIQEAIRLHEASQYERSTAMFGRLADPNGPNNPLSQVLYGLALRHGWGIEKNPTKAVEYLQAAAKNSAAVEKEALKAGMTKGGSAKGELVLAIYEVCLSIRPGTETSQSVSQLSTQNSSETLFDMAGV